MSRTIVLADFFSGCGGTSLGFAKAGIEPVLAIDWDPDAVATYRLNFPETETLERDIRDLAVSDFAGVLGSPQDAIRLFAGCAPCQPFAGHQKQSARDDNRVYLLLEFLRFVKEFNPELIFVENVSGMQRFAAPDSPFAYFVQVLSKSYSVQYNTILSADYGSPR